MIDGVISSREVFHHWLLIARLFGVRSLARCVVATARRERTTFLAVLAGPREGLFAKGSITTDRRQLTGKSPQGGMEAAT
jgi:hypothetical protein